MNKFLKLTLITGGKPRAVLINTLNITAVHPSGSPTGVRCAIVLHGTVEYEIQESFDMVSSFLKPAEALPAPAPRFGHPKY